MFWFGRRDYGELKDFQRELASARLVRRYHRGLVTAPVDKVIGSVSKAASMDRRFRYKNGKVDARLRRMRQANRWGLLTLPPVELYELNGEYYVVDGHHRLALALENGQPDIDAVVVAHEVEPATEASGVTHHAAGADDA